MEEENKVSGIQFINVENKNGPSFSDGDDVYKYSEASFTQKSIKEESLDEVNDTDKTQNDLFTYSDEEKEKADNGINTIYNKEEPVFVAVKVENVITDNNEYSDLLEDTKDTKENIIVCPDVYNDVASRSVYEDDNPHCSRDTHGRDTTSLSDHLKVTTYQENDETLFPNFLVDVQTSLKEAEDYECVKLKRCYTQRKSFIDINTAQKKLKNYECHIYNRTFTQARNLTRHIKSIHGGIKYKCEECKSIFSTKRSLKRHIDTGHKNLKNHEGQICKEASTQSSSLVKHIENIHNEIIYNCEEGEEGKSSYTNVGIFKKHIDTPYKKLKNYKCQICLKIFTKLKLLENHIKSVHERIRYKCEECRNSYSDLGNLKRHIDNVHKKLKTHECQTCKKTFTQSCGLTKHIKSIHEGIKYKCELCNNNYSDMGVLNRHINTTHKKLKNFMCQICKNTFTESRSLENHIKSIHEGIRYKCEECQNSYTDIGHLKRHIDTVHKKLKSHECHICKKAFAQSPSLKQHIRSIHEGIKYECEECKINYTLMSSLKKHIITTH